MLVASVRCDLGVAPCSFPEIQHSSLVPEAALVVSPIEAYVRRMEQPSHTHRTEQGHATISYASWIEALPNIRTGDRLRMKTPDGSIGCAEVMLRDIGTKGPTGGRPILRP